ncbi:MAG TPA: hypothetical protein VMI52_03815 [Acetobacteraceae bacterium]|nr:hypothetical protein [Acetobacteraceae bacterium]
MTPTSRPTVRFSAIARIAIPLLALPHLALAQANPTLTNLVPESERVSLQAKITAINPATRAITLRGPSGASVTLTAGPAVRLNLLKPGQTVNAEYYRSVGFVVTPPTGGNGTPTSNDQITTALARPVQAPGGVGIRVTKVSGTVVGIDLAAHRIDVVNPSGGGVYTLDVTDPARIASLPTLKVGDTITAVISETLAVSIVPVSESRM